MRRHLLTTACAVAALAACSPKAPAEKSAATNTTPPPAAAPAGAPQPGEPVVPGAPGQTQAPAGVYAIDPHHSTLVFRVSHLGFSHYRGQFTKVDGQLTFDPAHPAAMSVTATIDPKSLSIPTPPPGFKDTLLGKDWLNAGQFPQITFRSTKVEPTGPNSANVTGELTLHGVTKPVILETVFNGGYPANAFDGARVGFSAHGQFRRSDFGIAYGVPAPGTNMGVGDRVDFTLETEWSNGKPTGPAPTAPPAKS